MDSRGLLGGALIPESSGSKESEYTGRKIWYIKDRCRQFHRIAESRNTIHPHFTRL